MSTDPLLRRQPRPARRPSPYERQGDDARRRLPAPTPGPNGQMRERRTAYAMLLFGFVLGGLELFIVAHYL